MYENVENILQSVTLHQESHEKLENGINNQTKISSREHSDEGRRERLTFANLFLVSLGHSLTYWESTMKEKKLQNHKITKICKITKSP